MRATAARTALRTVRTGALASLVLAAGLGCGADGRVRDASDPLGAPSPAPVALPLPAPLSPARIGTLGGGTLVETSGLAASPRDGRVLWAINDSGAEPVLHALDLVGAPLGRVRIDAGATDWEDLASGTLAGVPTLIVADVGDNARRRKLATLYLVAEPDVPGLSSGAAAAAGIVDGPAPYATIDFRYEDGPQDVESVGFADEAFWLLTKARPQDGSPVASGVYRLDASAATVDAAIDSAARGERASGTARRVATMAPLDETLATRAALALAGVDLNHPTALDIDVARGLAWVLTYREVLRFERRGDESWGAVLARPGTVAYTHALPQAEALAATSPGLVVFTSEGSLAPLMGLMER